MTIMVIMMPLMQDFITARAIIERWPSRRQLASDMTDEMGRSVDVYAIHRWHQRNRIPAEYDLAMLRAAERRRIGLSLVDLVNARCGHADQCGHTTANIQDGDAA